MSNIEATSFIKKALGNFVKSFPETRVRYEFDINANVHCIEVVPNDIYHLDKKYISWENNTTDEFIKLFPDQNICFFSDDAIVGINDTQFKLAGSKYINDITITSNIEFSSILFDKVNVHFDSNFTSIPSISSPDKVFNNGIVKTFNCSYISTSKTNSIASGETQTISMDLLNYLLAA